MEVLWGVFSSDQIRAPELTSRPQCMIINLDPSNLPGSHWVAVCLHKTRAKHKVLEYFDSYGSLAPEFQTPPGWKLRYSLHALQAAFSSVCGHYCVYFTDLRLQGVEYHTILQNLISVSDSDSFVENYVSSKYESLLKIKWNRNWKP